MQREEQLNYESPTMCGCSVLRTVKWGLIDADVEKEVALTLDKVGRSESDFSDEASYLFFRQNIKNNIISKAQNTIVAVENSAITSQCKIHGAFGTPDALYDELNRYGGIKYSPDTCGCSLYYYYDKSSPENKISVEHPDHTKRCDAHKNIGSAEELFSCIFQENSNKNEIVNALAENLNTLVESIEVKPTDIPFEFDDNRNLVIDTNKFDTEKFGIEEDKVTVDKVELQKVVDSIEFNAEII